MLVSPWILQEVVNSWSDKWGWNGKKLFVTLNFETMFRVNATRNAEKEGECKSRRTKLKKCDIKWAGAKSSSHAMLPTHQILVHKSTIAGPVNTYEYQTRTHSIIQKPCYLLEVFFCFFVFFYIYSQRCQILEWSQIKTVIWGVRHLGPVWYFSESLNNTPIYLGYTYREKNRNIATFESLNQCCRHIACQIIKSGGDDLGLRLWQTPRIYRVWKCSGKFSYQEFSRPSEPSLFLGYIHTSTSASSWLLKPTSNIFSFA